MNISWVLADNIVLDPLMDVDQLKKIGPIWGSWKTWRACATDNVICHNLEKSRELLKRNFQNTCNFYIPNKDWINLDRPEGIRLYEGSFIDETVQPDEIVAMHLAASTSEIVLLLGFNLREPVKLENKLDEHNAHVYRTLVKHCIEDNAEVQWVLVDHPEPVMKMLAGLPNLVQDTMDTALSLLDS